MMVSPMKVNSQSKTALKHALISLILIGGVVGCAYRVFAPTAHREIPGEGGVEQAVVRKGIQEQLASAASGLGSSVRLDLDGRSVDAQLSLTIDPLLQSEMEALFSRYSPDYGAFVAVEPETGKVLSLVSHSHDAEQSQSLGNLALRATFPSASIFKVVTAAAAIAEKNFSGNTLISFTGSNHTLYKSHVLRESAGRWARQMTLREAFGRSVNTVFGKIGAFSLGSERLKDYAERFGFNREIPSDLPIQEGTARIVDDAWSLAESASGYTLENRMSPLQGALIAASIANDGAMMQPYVVQSAHDSKNGELIYDSQPRLFGHTTDPETAKELKVLMRETVEKGTSRKAFRGFFKGRFSELDVGGKTGSLTGDEPRGKYDWFVGYADWRGKKIAICALTVHGKLWKVKSSYLARRSIENYFSRQIASKNLSASSLSKRNRHQN